MSAEPRLALIHVKAKASSQAPSSAQAVAGEPPISTVEQALRSLLRVRGRREMERAVLEAACGLTEACAAALYRWEEAGFELRATCGLPVDWPATVAEAGDAGGEEGGGGFRVDARGRRLAAVLKVDGERHLLLLEPSPGEAPFGPEAAETLERLLEPCALALQNAALLDRLQSLVLIDPLTGCHNRRGFDEHLKVELVRARRYRRALSLLVLDIDHFKQINDGYGHPCGDAILRRVGEVLRAEFRTTDVVCRFGGDEFAVIFPETPGDEVMRLAERIRARVEGLYPADPLPRVLTVSLGIAAFPEHGDEPEALMHAADRALYRAKAGGRNRVVGA